MLRHQRGVLQGVYIPRLQEPGVGVGVVRSAWFLVLAGGAVAMLVVVVSCTVTARWCARGLQALPRGKFKAPFVY